MKFFRMVLCAALMCGGFVASAQVQPAVQPVSPGVPGVPPVAPAGQFAAPSPQDTQAQRQIIQPGNNAPMWRTVKSGTQNYASIPDREAGVLIQPKAQFPGQARATTAGEAWRQYRNGPVTIYGGWVLLIVAAAILAFYLIRGTVRLKTPPTGRLIERFTPLERTAHWSMAISFVILGVTGLMMLFGKYVVLPVLGHAIFGFLTYIGKTVHNFIGPFFAASVLVSFVIFVKDNFPGKYDLPWLLKGGGMLGGEHVHAPRFNGGEKLWFWGGMVFLGIVVSVSGFFLDLLVPGFNATRGNMQVAHLVHAIGAVLFVMGSFGHIYLGTIGMQGAYRAMRDGWVDETWAAEHHDIWLADIKAGRVPAVRTPTAEIRNDARTPLARDAALR